MKNGCRSSRLRCAFLITVVTSVGTMLAVDPLPSELEQSSLEAKRAFFERQARESQELKTKVAEQRYAQRAAMKQSIVEALQAEADARRAEFDLPLGNAALPGVKAPEAVAFRRFVAALVVALTTALIALQRKRLVGLFRKTKPVEWAN